LPEAVLLTPNLRPYVLALLLETFNTEMQRRCRADHSFSRRFAINRL